MAVGFEADAGWENERGRGANFRAPMGAIEWISGANGSTGMERIPSDLLIEVSSLGAARDAAQAWMQANARPAESLAEIMPLEEWETEIFTAEPVPGVKVMFWQWSEPLKGKAAALEGDLVATGMRFAIVVTRWNSVITDRLLQGALDCLLRSGAKRGDIEVVRVPGAWEIPDAARTLATTGAGGRCDYTRCASAR